jgi:hypothetical protein
MQPDRRTRLSRFGHKAVGLLLGAVMAASLAAPVAAAGPERIKESFPIMFPDFDRGLAIFINTTREAQCTPEAIAAEEAFLEWLEGPMNEPPPPEAPYVPGIKDITIQEKVTGKGALVSHMKGSGLLAEIWPMVDDPPGVGPCLDTSASSTPWVGTARVQGNDNDVFVSETRGNSWGDSGRATVFRNGKKAVYSWRFHLNDRCYVPEDGPPACLIEQSSFKVR